MSRLALRSHCAALALALVLSAPAWSADKKDKEDIALERHEKVLAEARKRVDQVKREATQAKGAAERAEEEARKQRIEHEKVRQGAIERHDQDPQLVRARQEFAQVEAEFKGAAAPVLQKLASDPAHLARLRHREAVRQQLATVPPGAREPLAAQLLAATQAVSQAESGALDADPAASAAKKKLGEVRAKLQPLVDERDRKITNDPQVQRSSAEIAGSKRKADLAQGALERAVRELAEAQKHLAGAEQEHKRLAEAERRDDARDRQQPQKKNNKKK